MDHRQEHIPIKCVIMYDLNVILMFILISRQVVSSTNLVLTSANNRSNNNYYLGSPYVPHTVSA